MQQDTNAQPDIPSSENSASQSDATVLVNLEQMIKTTTKTIDLQKSELRKHNEMVTSALENDATYQEHAKAAKDAAKVKNATKAELLKQPALATTMAKIKELRMELKEQQQALSEYLREYGRMSGSNEIEMDDGDLQQIVYVAKLVRRSGTFKQ